MIKVIGTFKNYGEHAALIFDLPDHYFNVTVEHVNKNMFLSFKRPNSKFKEILICSVGDHLDKDNRQDYTKADLAIYISINQQLDKDMMKALEEAHTWYVCVKNKNNIYLFSLDKDTEYIKERKLYTNAG